MTKPEVVARKLLILNETLGHLGRGGTADPSALRRDPMLLAAVERWLQVAIEACSDLAFHVVASEGWTPPSSGRGAFDSLAAHGRIDPSLAGRLGLAYGLHNLLVHDYADVDLAQLAEAVACAHVDLRAFAATFAPPPTPP
jgi:uncharacterized protein YutE (UPF0331/DUF86 family)